VKENKGATYPDRSCPPPPDHAPTTSHPASPRPSPRPPKVGQDEHSHSEGGQGHGVAHGVDHAQAVKYLLCRWETQSENWDSGWVLG
jgi:hypothetical protein